jgi:hypothetical protein
MIRPWQDQLYHVIPGVYRFGNRWRSQIRVKNKVIHLGYFDTLSEAFCFFNYAAKQYYGSLFVWWQLKKGHHKTKGPRRRERVLPNLDYERNELIAPSSQDLGSISDILFKE